MKTKIILILSLLSLFIVFDSFAQSMQINEIFKLKQKQSGSINNNGVVEGHYIFYTSGKPKKGIQKHTLRILDTELNIVTDKYLQLDQKAVLLNAATNGRSLAFRFWDPKNKRIVTKGYGFKGEALFTKNLSIVKGHEIAMLTAAGVNTDFGLVAIPDYGYAQIVTRKEKKFTYSIHFISDVKGQKGFVKRGSSEKYEGATNICTVGDVMINLISSRDKTFKVKGMDMQVQGINVKTGKQTFKTSLLSKGYNTLIINGAPHPDGENIILYGLNFPEGEKITGKSIGMIKLVVTQEGKVLDDKTFDWQGKSIKLDEGEEAGNIFVHDFITIENGHTYMIAEQINLNVGGSVASSVVSGLLGGSTVNTQFKIDDLLILELDKNFDLIDVEIVDKSRNNFTIEGIPFGGILAIGMMADAYGYFDYSYFQMLDEGFQIAYIDYERQKGTKNGLVLGGVTNIDGEYSYDKIDISNKGVETWVKKAKPGYVLIYDYIKKEKSLSLRLEKINF